MELNYCSLWGRIAHGYHLSKVGGSLASKIKLFILPWIFTRSENTSILKKLNNGNGLAIYLAKYGNRAILYLYDYSDFLVFNEVFIKNIYELSEPKDIKIILDLGSNTGISIIFFKLKYPKAKILGVEANPEIFSRLRNNVIQFKDSVKIFNYLIHSNINFLYVHKNRSLSSSIYDRGAGFKKVKVNSYTFDQLMNHAGISYADILKVDIEGSEYDALRTANLKNFCYIIGEIHEDLGSSKVEDFVELFRDFDEFRYRQEALKRFSFIAIRKIA